LNEEVNVELAPAGLVDVNPLPQIAL